MWIKKDLCIDFLYFFVLLVFFVGFTQECRLFHISISARLTIQVSISTIHTTQIFDFIVLLGYIMSLSLVTSFSSNWHEN